ncbi:MAG: hypothetical protein HDQ87_09440 [Clostridia bacterium]|nr:hypothetical protein [Clostridia bacterium]
MPLRFASENLDELRVDAVVHEEQCSAPAADAEKAAGAGSEDLNGIQIVHRSSGKPRCVITLPPLPATAGQVNEQQLLHDSYSAVLQAVQ